MNIIITGNVVEGFKFYGPFHDITETEAALVLGDHPEGVWTELVFPHTDPDVTFEVRKVDVARGPFWTVVKLNDGVVEGGDHHWLTKELAEAASMIYNVEPALHAAHPAVMQAAFERLFQMNEWPSMKIIDVER